MNLKKNLESAFNIKSKSRFNILVSIIIFFSILFFLFFLQHRKRKIYIFFTIRNSVVRRSLLLVNLSPNKELIQSSEFVMQCKSIKVLNMIQKEKFSFLRQGQLNYYTVAMLDYFFFLSFFNELPSLCVNFSFLFSFSSYYVIRGSMQIQKYL